jgi:hypothetical protein
LRAVLSLVDAVTSNAFPIEELRAAGLEIRRTDAIPIRNLRDEHGDLRWRRRGFSF